MPLHQFLRDASLACLLFGVGFGGYALGTDHGQRTRCPEDSVIVWTGERHDRCVPLDDISDLTLEEVHHLSK